MKQMHKIIEILTQNKNLYEVTKSVKDFVVQSKIFEGLVNVSTLHTSCSLIVQENADDSVKKDILNFFEKLCPENFDYNHQSEGLDDMPAHLRAVITQNSLTFSVVNNEILLGQWQGIYLFEHRRNKKIRKIQLHILGE